MRDIFENAPAATLSFGITAIAVLVGEHLRWKREVRPYQALAIIATVILLTVALGITMAGPPDLVATIMIAACDVLAVIACIRVLK